MKYPRLIDGQGVTMDARKVFRFACCDCGLVHDMVLVPSGRGRKVGLAVKRNQRATAAMRRTRRTPPTVGTKKALKPARVDRMLRRLVEAERSTS